MIPVMVIDPDAKTIVLCEVREGDLEAWRECIGGGWLEGIGGEGWAAYLDEEGKINGLAPNYLADHLARQLGWQGHPGDILCGPVVFFGGADANGNEVGVPELVLSMIKFIIEGT